METYAAVHRWADIKIVNYLVRPRVDHAVLPNPAVFDTLQRDAAIELYANCAEARIAVTEVALQHVLNHPALQRGPVCLVTLVPACFARPLGEDRARSREENAFWRSVGRAATFDVRLLRQTARQALGDIPFLGVIEAALYHRWGPDGPDRGDWISWHVHALTWGRKQSEISQMLAPFRARHSSMLKDVPAAHVQAVDPADLARQLLYTLKAPQKMTRVAYYSRSWTSPTTGEVKPPGYHQQKDWLQTGQRIRLLDVMGHRTLEDLIFGNGAGTALRREIFAEVLAPFHARERQRSLARLH